LRSHIVEGEQTACEYLTAHEVTLWPLEITEAEYLASTGAVTGLGVPGRQGLKAGLRLRLHCTGGLTFDRLPLDRLSLFLRGEETAFEIYEQLLGNLLDLVVQPTQRPIAWYADLPASTVKRLGFENEQALVPYTARSFEGYRLLQEYFAFPERFLFVELTGMQAVIRRCDADELDLIFLFNRANPALADAVDASHFNLFCTPAVNLFPKRADRIHLSPRTAEYHIVPDRTRPMDFEVFGISKVLGYGDRAEPELEFLPFYEVKERYRRQHRKAYYTLFREQRRLSAREREQQRRGDRSIFAGKEYRGSESYISLVDAEEAPFSSDLKQLGLSILCTNRHLPLKMPIGMHPTDFYLQTGAPYESIHCIAGPTPPRASNAFKQTAWHLISHLSLNYLSLIDNDMEQGAAALRQILSLYGDYSELAVRKQIDGLLSIHSEPVARRIDAPKQINAPIPITFARGLEVTVNFDESAFKGSGVFLLGAVLEQFFARYVGINSFTETVIRTTDREEIMRWPARIGQRHIL
jgi:type VI secretion system protein ImpG